MNESHKLVKRILGIETSSLNHPMWSECYVLNNLIYCTVFHRDEIVWRGIAEIERVAKLIDKLPEVTIFKTPLKAGFHY